MKAAAALLACAALLQAQTPVFRSNVDVIAVPVSVVSGNRPVPDLSARDFELLDNGVPQTLTMVPLKDREIDITLVVDTSGSIEGPALDQIKREIRAIAGSLASTDRLRLITFGDDVEMPVAYTAGTAAIDLERLHAGGATSLYAALTAALIVDPAETRPQLVFTMTDGRDNASFASAEGVLALSGRSNACLYIALVPDAGSIRYSGSGRATNAEENTVMHPEQQGIFTGVSSIRRTMGPYAGGPNTAVLKGIAARSGGGFYEEGAHRDMAELFRRAIDDFRQSYLLSYTPTNAGDSGWHGIAVRVKNHGYTIRARKGYSR